MNYLCEFVPKIGGTKKENIMMTYSFRDQDMPRKQENLAPHMQKSFSSHVST